MAEQGTSTDHPRVLSAIIIVKMTSKLNLLPKDVLARLKELPERVAHLEGLSALWLFGSIARGEATSLSDVDLAYLPDQDLAGEALESFENRLYRVISATLGTDEFSLINMRQAPVFLRWRVLAEGILLWCRDEESVASLAEKTFGQAPDIQRLKASGNAEFLEAFKMKDRTVEKERVTEILRLISQDLLILREKAQVPMEAYLNSRDLQSIVERRLQTAIEGTISIGNHIVARLGLQAPQDYADVFRILQEANVLPAELAQEMMDMARFWGLLVHVYWEIDHKRIYETLPQRLKTLEDFAQCIGRWLTETAGKR